MEAFSYVTQHPEGGEPGEVGIRRQAFALDTLHEGRMPYASLLARTQRFAFREFSHDPNLRFADFQEHLGEYIFGEKADALEDLLELQRIFTFESDWYWPSPLLDPAFLARRAKRLNWSAEKLATYRENLVRLRRIAQRYQGSENSAERELGRLAQKVVAAWEDRSP
jgi:hypothetical protein